MDILKKPEFIFCLVILVIVILIAVFFWWQMGQIKSGVAQGKEDQDMVKGNVVQLKSNQEQVVQALRSNAGLVQEVLMLRKRIEDQQEVIRKMAERIDQMQTKQDDMRDFLKVENDYRPKTKAKKTSMAEELMRTNVVPVSAPPQPIQEDEDDAPKPPRSILKSRGKAVTIKDDDDADDLVAKAAGR